MFPCSHFFHPTRLFGTQEYLVKLTFSCNKRLVYWIGESKLNIMFYLTQAQGWSTPAIPRSRQMKNNIKRGPLKKVHRKRFLTFRITNFICGFWISRQALYSPKIAGRTNLAEEPCSSIIFIKFLSNCYIFYPFQARTGAEQLNHVKHVTFGYQCHFWQGSGAVGLSKSNQTSIENNQRWFSFLGWFCRWWGFGCHWSCR